MDFFALKHIYLKKQQLLRCNNNFLKKKALEEIYPSLLVRTIMSNP